MVLNYSPSDPTPLIVKAFAGGSAGTGTHRGMVHVSVPIATGSANAATNWKNAEGHDVMAEVSVVIRVAGSGGTFDVGLSQDGTGSNDNIINGGTLDVVQVITPGTVLSTAVTGNLKARYLVRGSGTNNSIVMKHNDAGGTGTVAGYMVVSYVPLG